MLRFQSRRKLGTTLEEKDLYEWNARVQITTWGNRTCADDGGLRDYAHKEWNGILRDFYYMRWAAYWRTLQDQLDGSYLNATADTYTITYDGQKEGETFTTEASPYAEVLLSEGKVTDEQETFLTEWELLQYDEHTISVCDCHQVDFQISGKSFQKLPQTCCTQDCQQYSMQNT